MKGKRFKNLISKYQRGKATDDEIALIDKWLASFKGDERNIAWTEEEKDLRLKNIWQEIEGAGPVREKDNDRVLTFRYVLKIAASVLVMITVSYSLWHFYHRYNAPEMTVQVSAGSLKKVFLADGTIVWLKGGSKLIYPGEFENGTREVELNGEALFEVAKDPAWPFLIHCGEFTARVLGTSFNLKTLPNNIELLVLTGKVDLTAQTDPIGISVLANEKVVYDGRRRPSKVPAGDGEKSILIRGTEYSMHFKDTRMNEILERIERKFNVQVNLDQGSVQDCMITADFTDQSLGNTLSMTSEILGFQYMIKGSIVNIHGGGCRVNNP